MKQMNFRCLTYGAIKQISTTDNPMIINHYLILIDLCGVTATFTYFISNLILLSEVCEIVKKKKSPSRLIVVPFLELVIQSDNEFSSPADACCGFFIFLSFISLPVRFIANISRVRGAIPHIRHRVAAESPPYRWNQLQRVKPAGSGPSRSSL